MRGGYSTLPYLTLLYSTTVPHWRAGVGTSEDYGVASLNFELAVLASDSLRLLQQRHPDGPQTALHRLHGDYLGHNFVDRCQQGPTGG